MSPLEFLEHLWRGKPDNLYTLIWRRHGKQSHWFRQIADAANFIENGHATDVYVGVGLSPSDNGEHHRCVSEEVAGIPGLWADFDILSAAHPNKALPKSIEEALAIIPSGLPPTIMISTGNGLQAWWLFEEPWIFGTFAERDEAVRLSDRFQTMLDYNASQKGWAFDRLSDLARVLRIPGTINAKDPSNPKKVEVHSIERRRYRVTEIWEYLDRLAIPDVDSRDRTRQRLKKQFTDSTLIVNLNGVIPDELLSSWLKNDARFRRTWARERDDLADQSGSGYDMALACFGIGEGLTDQQIVDLIVQHRRQHGDAQRKRVDYFHRTIAKARQTTGTHMNLPSIQPQVDQLAVEGNGVPNPTGGSDSTRKAQLCDQLSELLGIRILRLLKLPGSDPIYLMELEDGRIEFDIARLTTQRPFRLAIAAKADKIIPTYKSRDWEALTQMMLDACTVLDSTDDMQLEGTARVRVYQYLADNTILPDVDSASRRDLLKPLIWKGQITLHTTDLQNFFSQTAKQSYSVHRLAAMLTAIGAKTVRVRGGAFGDQSRWGLPLDEFDPRDFVSTYLEGGGDAA